MSAASRIAGLVALATCAGAAVLGVELLAVRRSARRAAAGPHAPADAIVVLGASADEAGPSPELAARLGHGAQLWRAGLAPTILMAGGVADGIDEIDAMTDHVVATGIPREAIAPLRPAASTRQTIRSLAARPGSYIAVSSPFHARRIEREARRHGVRLTVAVPAVTPVSAHAGVHRLLVAMELIAIAWYAMPEPLTRRVHTGPGSLRQRVPALLGDLIAPDRERAGGRRRAP